ncbi:MAG: TatD family hydrolase [Myxococcaceae bacterium]|nr:TatD family hydrolase [Myxococcaceae bacterium]
MAESPSPLFDAHLHPEGLSDDDLESMRLFGVEEALIVTHHKPHPALKAKDILEDFDHLLGRELRRCERAGIRAWAALGVHPQSLPPRGLPEVLSALPGYFTGGKVVAVGEIGFHRGGEAEAEAFTEQLSLAKRLKLPVVVHTPQRSKETLTRRALTLIRASGIGAQQVLVDHCNAKTVRLVLECGHTAGLTVHPDELSAERAVAQVRALGTERLVMNSDSGYGASDILGLARAARLLEKGELSPAVIARVTRTNARRFFRIDAA